MSSDSHNDLNDTVLERLETIAGKPFSMGAGFNALSFNHGMFSGMMDPLIMVDYFVMTEPTFGPHAHAGLSAVSILFEDSRGAFHNKDSLGNDIDLFPGDLYWLKAAAGAVHDEKPRPGARTHALQVFVNLPARMKYDAPDSLHVKAPDMPIMVGDGFRARLVLGASGEVKGKSSPALPMTIMDVNIRKGAKFEHSVPSGHKAFILSIDGAAGVHFNGQTATLARGKSVSVGGVLEEKSLTVGADEDAHIAILQAEPIREKFVQRGPFAMATEAEVDAMFSAHEQGKLGSIDA